MLKWMGIGLVAGTATGIAVGGPTAGLIGGIVLGAVGGLVGGWLHYGLGIAVPLQEMAGSDRRAPGGD